MSERPARCARTGRAHSAAPAWRRPSTATGGRSSRAGPPAPARLPTNSTLAIVIPVTRLFFEPQNTIAISSSREKPKRRAAKAVIGKHRRQQRATDQRNDEQACGRRAGPQAGQGRRAEHAIDHQQDGGPIDQPTTGRWRCSQPSSQGRRTCPARNGNSRCATTVPTPVSEARPRPAAAGRPAAASAPCRRRSTARRCTAPPERCRRRSR